LELTEFDKINHALEINGNINFIFLIAYSSIFTKFRKNQNKSIFWYCFMEFYQSLLTKLTVLCPLIKFLRALILEFRRIIIYTEGLLLLIILLMKITQVAKDILTRFALIKMR
jgi:hypothetical protein